MAGIFFNTGINTGGFESGAKQLQSIAGRASAGITQHFGKIAAAVVGIGAAFIGIRAAVQSFNAAIAMGGKLNDLSARTGETAGNLAILQRAFENAGAGADAVGPTINRLQRAIVEAGEGGKQQAEAFAKLGLNLSEIRNLTPTEQLKAVAKALQGVGNDSERGALAMQLLGRSGGELLPLFRAMGSELDVARNQLGSLPGVMDKTVAALDTIGDNFNAIGEKGTEFAAGLLQNIAPALADLTTRMANIDAAGFGAKLSEYAESTLRWVAETFKLTDALSNIEKAINGITSGNFGDGLSLMFMTARDTAFNAINQIVAAGMAALQVVGDALRQLFDPSSTTMAFINGSFNMLGAKIASGIFDSLASVLEKIPFMGAASEAVRAAQQEAEQAAEDIANIMYYEADNLKKEWGGILAEAPKNFAAAFDQFAKDPLIDMTERTKETAEQAERVERATRAAAFNAETFGTALREAQLDRLSGGGYNPFGAPPETGETMGANKDGFRFPWQGGGPSGPQTFAAAPSSPKSTAKAPAPKALGPIEQLQEAAKTDARARAELMRLQNEQASGMNRAGDLRERGFFSSSARAEIRAEQTAQRRAERFLAEQIATDRFGGNNMGEAFRNFRDMMAEQGILGSNQRDFEKWAREQAKSETERKREDETSKNQTAGGSPAAPISDMASDIAKIKEVLTKADGIHDRLPIRVLAAA